MANSTTYDVVIIGAGFAGLSAAALLANQGRRVVVLEQAARLGGRASYFEQDGFTWQYGQHSHRLAKDGIAAQVFDRLGDPLEFIDTRKDTAYLYFDGSLYPRPEGLLGFLRSSVLPLKARFNFLRFFVKLLAQDAEDWYDRTFLDMYRQWHSDPYLERFLSFLSFTIMIPDPAMASAGEVIHFLKRAARARVKQGEPKGGSKQVIEKLQRAIERGRGEIRLSEPAEAILVEHGRAVGVRTGVGEYRADRVVAAFPLFHLFELISEDQFRPDFIDHVKGIRSSSGLSIDFVFDEPVTDIKGGILGVDVPLWVKFQSNIDTTIAPPGKHVTTWAMLFEPGATITKQLVDETEARIKSIMEETIPGALAKVVRERKLVLPVINANMLIPRQSYPHRPAIACEEVERLYFIGDTTQGDGCSGDIAFSSAMKLANLIGLRD